MYVCCICLWYLILDVAEKEDAFPCKNERVRQFDRPNICVNVAYKFVIDNISYKS